MSCHRVTKQWSIIYFVDALLEMFQKHYENYAKNTKEFFKFYISDRYYAIIISAIWYITFSKKFCYFRTLLIVFEESLI